ncbi:MAG: hypothetical protein ABIE14_05535 [Patescibacteria group bacterium]
MPKILTTTTGIFPKIGGSAPSLRANLHKLDREEISVEELESVLQANIKRAVEEQVEAGIDLPTDGLIRWTDLFSPFVSAWDGLTRRGIHRFYNTNTLYGEPVIESELKYNPSKTLEDFKFALNINPSVKAALPGVFSFAAACVDNFYKNAEKLREVIAANLLKEAEALAQAGAKVIEIHEPELAWNMEHGTRPSSAVADYGGQARNMDFYKQLGKLEAKVIVTSYFRNFSEETAKALVEAGCGVGIDFTQPQEVHSLPEGAIVQAGVVDARETKLEASEDLQKLKGEIVETFQNAAEIIFSTSSHVEYLPHGKALEKIALLKNLK